MRDSGAWSGPRTGCVIKFLFPSFSSSFLTLTPIRVLEILLLFKNFKVVLKHFESLYMNGSNFSSSQHKV